MTLCQGNVQKLCESDDLLGVFICVSALHNTFKERAPALYEQSVQLRLAEWYTVYQENVWVNGEIIWRGRTIPRANVVPVPARRGDYLDLDGDRVFAEPYYYSPPSTASETERNRTR